MVHVIHRLAVGGLENGLVNLIDHMPAERYRHAIVCLTDFTEFRERLRRADVPVVALHKRTGNDPGMHRRLWLLFRRWRPAIVHTRNFSMQEYLVSAALAGVPGRVHGEHGRDMNDLDGTRLKYNLWRRALRSVVHRYVAVSADLARWLVLRIGVPEGRVAQIYNGVDVECFYPRREPRTAAYGGIGFAPPGATVIGTVGRMEPVKDQLTLVRAFLRLLESRPGAREGLRLVLVGDGSLREGARTLLCGAGAEKLAWLPGERDDVAELMRGFDVFVLPSLREGVSNTILEAMATGLPVVATRVGGNPELVANEVTGTLVPPAEPDAMAAALARYLDAPELIRRQGEAARRRVEACFSMASMVEGYLAVYDQVRRRQRCAA